MDFRAIAANALAFGPGLLSRWFPAGKMIGNEFCVGNLDGKSGKSLKINVRTGRWADFKHDEKGGDLISLYAAKEKISQKEAADAISRQLGGSYDQPKSKKSKSKSRAKSKPIQKPAALNAAPEGTKPPSSLRRKQDDKWVSLKISQSWLYQLPTGEHIAYDCRIDYKDGSKDIIPVIWGAGKWKQGSLPKPRPLYGLDQLQNRPLNMIIICEGCKAADAAAKLLPQCIAMSWQGGTKAVKYTDWHTLLHRKVLIWPDADEPGGKAALQIAALLYGKAKEIRIIKTEGLADTWDAADALAEGMTPKQALEWTRDRALEYQPEEPPQAQPDDYGSAQTPDLDPLDMPFNVLGYGDDLFYFLPKGSGQVRALTAPQMQKNTLFALADRKWWTDRYDGLSRSGEQCAANMLIQLSYKAGIFSPRRIRGRGAWLDEGRKVVNLGNALLVDGQEVHNTNFKSYYIYEVGETLPLDLSNPLSTQEAHKLIDLMKLATWRYEMSAELMAGWIVSAMVGGIFTWRQHAYICGPSNSGKSTMQDRIIGPLLKHFAIHVAGGTTEAALRQSLKFDVLPVIVDEFEAETKRAMQLSQDVLSFMRKASSGGSIRKGGPGGKPVFYLARQAFCVASVNKAMTEYADESRIMTFNLCVPTGEDVDERWQAYKRIIHETVTPQFSLGLFARAVKYLDVLVHNERIFSAAAATVFGERRSADGLGFILAGTYLLHSHKEVVLDSAISFIKRHDWAEHTSINSAKDKDRILSHVLAQRIRINNEDFTVGELIDIASEIAITSAATTHERAKKELARVGILVYPRSTTENNPRIAFAERGPFKVLVADTPWSANWKEPLRDVPGAMSGQGPIYFFRGNQHRSTIIPMSVFKDEGG